MALTAKQEAFAQAVASGLSHAAAYRQCYDVSPDALPQTSWSNGYALATATDVSLRIDELKAAVQAAATAELAWDAKRLVREAATQLEIARTGGWRAVSAGNGALELIGRLTGMLSEHPREQLPAITRVVIVLQHGKNQDGEPRVVEGELAAPTVSKPSTVSGRELDTPGINSDKAKRD